jgi:hypothetical protein
VGIAFQLPGVDYCDIVVQVRKTSFLTPLPLQSAEQKQLWNELEGMLRPAELDRKDIDIIRKDVFSNSTFYVTSVTQVSDARHPTPPPYLLCAAA